LHDFIWFREIKYHFVKIILAYVCVLRIRKTDSIYINENIIGGSWTAVGNTRTEHQQTVDEHQPRSHPVSCGS
jgi:hypothetical protein